MDMRLALLVCLYVNVSGFSWLLDLGTLSEDLNESFALPELH